MSINENSCHHGYSRQRCGFAHPLAEIDQAHVSHIYCLGDTITIGPESNEVLDTLFNRKNLSMITGNHDEGVLALIHRQPYPKSHGDTREPSSMDC
ncbi:hypothetical protein NIE88_08885 [Sporolactobacillus shoreicorticis]|uniref:Calcineurin-like phosphoesterase domain-containing protein n=1 Tax=Sporolactobacillus shoreicorticis TaxID=1923877 RepID=A0ABW5S236_9BACL|nr:hypothetical protein [Sporolactobacillus shoreicorticis]MCO7125886.1 hypothetical protein [Sporolactobacillus shoreicorticis]